MCFCVADILLSSPCPGSVVQGIEQVAGTVAEQAQPVAQRTADFLKEQAPKVAENAEPTAARVSEIAEGLAHEVGPKSLGGVKERATMICNDTHFLVTCC